MDQVRGWMSSPAVVAPETMTLPEARRLLQQRGIRRVPVVDAAAAGWDCDRGRHQQDLGLARERRARLQHVPPRGHPALRATL